VITGVRSGITGLEKTESIKLLDQGLHCVVISPYYENGTNTGTPAGQNKCHVRKDRLQSIKNGSQNRG
jgi:hypothetical protein